MFLQQGKVSWKLQRNCIFNFIPLVKSVISIMIMHMCLASTMMSLPVSSHLETSKSNLRFSTRKTSTYEKQSS
jgi:hypothetical protein